MQLCLLNTLTYTQYLTEMAGTNPYYFFTVNFSFIGSNIPTCFMYRKQKKKLCFTWDLNAYFWQNQMLFNIMTRGLNKQQKSFHDVINMCSDTYHVNKESVFLQSDYQHNQSHNCHIFNFNQICAIKIINRTF